MKVIAHRGNSAQFPENTLAAFRSAVEIGAAMVELDVQLSLDGRVVVIHDDTVDRTTAGHGAVAALGFEEMHALGIPSLEEVLALPVAVNVEIKAAGAAEAVVELVRGRGGVIVSSFDVDALERVRSLNPAQPLAYLCEEDTWPEVLQRAQDAGAVAVNPPRAAIGPELIARAHTAGLQVMTFTVNDPVEALRFRAWGVDAIFTDNPARMLAILGTCAEVAE